MGEVGKEEVEYEKILNHNKINQRKLNLNKKYKINQKTTISDIKNEKDLKTYKNMKDTFTVAIDPKGCIDIDDALSYENINNEHIVGIHIADVSAWIEQLDLYRFMSKRYFTVYCPDTKYNIFPNILSDNLFSLRRNKDRLALSLLLTLDNEYNIIKTEFQKTIVNVNVATSYEKANNLLNSKHKELTKLFNISKHLMNKEEEEDYDTHNMIQNYMLYANNKVAEHLIKNDKKPILRIHNEPKFQIKLEDINIDNKETLDFLKYYQFENAIYKKYDTDSIYYHYGLDIKYYTHFTSPIRRIVDVITHLLLKEVIDNKESEELLKIEIDCEKINEENKRNKKMSRDMEKVKILCNIEEKEYESYIVDLNENELSIYIPELKHLYRKKLFNKKLLDLLTIELTDNKLILKTNKKEITYMKYEKISIKLYKNLNNLEVKLMNEELFI